jgi:hypothetical protein
MKISYHRKKFHIARRTLAQVSTKMKLKKNLSIFKQNSNITFEAPSIKKEEEEEKNIFLITMWKNAICK